jgi:hypothetical protein
MKLALCRVLLVISVLSATRAAFAECQKDSRGMVVCGRGQCVTDIRGKVFCARYRYGAVVRLSNGRILCGKGQCAATLKGQWFCTTAEDGSVFKDWDGTIRCEEACEPASIANCEMSPAGR